MRLRDHRETAKLVDGEQADVMEFLDGQPDKSSDAYTKAVANLKTLEETKKMEVEMIHDKESLASEFLRGVAGGGVSAAMIYLIWHSEATGDVMLNQSNKGFLKDASRLKFRPGH